MSNELSMCEQGVFVGVPNLVDDHEFMEHSITLFRLRYLLQDVLSLNSFVPVIERHII